MQNQQTFASTKAFYKWKGSNESRAQYCKDLARKERAEQEENARLHRAEEAELTRRRIIELDRQAAKQSELTRVALKRYKSLIGVSRLRFLCTRWENRRLHN